MPESLRVIFAGTPDFAVPTLRALLESHHDVCAVYTQPDRGAGRGRKLTASPVKRCALEHGLEVRQPASLRDAAVQAELEACRADAMVVVAYGLMLPNEVLRAPALGCFNVHASLLPRWRGAAPIQRAVLAGDRSSGVTIMQMDAGLDTGDMLLKRELDIERDETSATLHDRLAECGASALCEGLDLAAAGKLCPEPQVEALACYAAKLSKDEALVDWQLPARQIHRQVCAFNPWPVSETRFRGERLRLWASCVIDADSTAPPGTVLAAGREGVDVATGDGVLRLRQLQMPGRKPQSAADFINAHSIEGERLGGT